MNFISTLVNLFGGGDGKFAVKCIIYACIYLLFVAFISSVVLKKTPEYEKGKKSNLPLLISAAVVNVIFFLMFAPHNLIVVKYTILTELLLYASASDIHKREVDDCVSLMLVILGFVDMTHKALLINLCTGVGFFVFFLIVAMIADGKFGGGDMKIISACAFVFGWQVGLAGVITGLASSLIVTLILRKKSKSEDRTMPLVPYLSAGYLISYISIYLLTR